MCTARAFDLTIVLHNFTILMTVMMIARSKTHCVSCVAIEVERDTRDCSEIRLFASFVCIMQ